MTKDREKSDYSQAGEEAEKTSKEILEIDQAIAEATQYLGELEEERQTAEAHNKFAREEGYGQTNIDELDQLIQSGEKFIAGMQKAKQEFQQMKLTLEQLGERARKLLLDYKGRTQ